MKKISYLILIILLSTLLPGMLTNIFCQSWSTVDGGGTNGINTSAAAYSRIPSSVVFNDLIYAAWQEKNSGVDQIHIKRYNGSTWAASGESGSKLNSSSSNALNPELAVYNGNLYAAYEEYDAGVYRIHVKKFDGTSWSLVQSYSPGDARTTINNSVTANATETDLAVYNGELYAAWTEEANAGEYNIRMSKFDGSNWTSIDGNGSAGLNFNTGKQARTPRIAVFNNNLYLAWIEVGGSGSVYQVHVKRYDGGSTWTSMDAETSDGLNYNPLKQASAPVIISYSNNLYLLWIEPYDHPSYGETNSLRVKKYNGSVWSFADGGLSNSGWNKDIEYPVNNPECILHGNLLYVTWYEADNPNFYNQIRVVKYDGTTKTFIDGGGATGINHDASKNAQKPFLTRYLGDLYALWHEDNSGSTVDQIRAKKTLLPPVVESVVVPADATYIAGQELNITVFFSKDVVISSEAPYIPITLNTGGTVNAVYSAGAGTSTMIFSYNVAEGNEDNDGISVGTAVEGGVLVSENETSLAADLTLYNVSSTTGVKIDAKNPLVSLGTTTDNPTDVSPIAVIISFSEPVTGLSADDIIISNGTKGALEGSGSSYSINITPAGQGILTVDVAAGVVHDNAGNGNKAATRLSINFKTHSSISGNAGSEGVTLSYTDGTPKTVLSDGSGAYSITVPLGWNGSIAPSKTGFTFTPGYKTYSDLIADQTFQDFIADIVTDSRWPRTKSASVNVYPTINHRSFKIDLDCYQTGKVEVNIYNLSGIILEEFEFQKNSQNATFEIGMSIVAKGYYIVEIIIGNNKMFRATQVIIVDQ